MTEDEKSYRKMVYAQARKVLHRPFQPELVDEVLGLLETVNGNKALGLKLRLQKKAAGEPYRFSDM